MRQIKIKLKNRLQFICSYIFVEFPEKSIKTTKYKIYKNFELDWIEDIDGKWKNQTIEKTLVGEILKIIKTNVYEK